jgi:hypothetical protein
MSINTKIRTVAAVAALAGLAVTGTASAATALRPGGPIAKPPVAGTITSAPEGAWAFPTGLNGGGTKANCANWNEVLGTDHERLNVAIGNNDLAAYTEAKQDLDRHTDEALDEGCAVIDE